MISGLSKQAGITGAWCSPHTFRHIFAVEFLRSGGNAFTLKELLGHASLAMTNRYMALDRPIWGLDIGNTHRAIG